MDALFAAVALKTLDSLSLRASVIAENIANASTAGYRPRQVNFEAALKAAAAKGPDAVAQVTPRLELNETARSDTDPRLDLELASAMATGGRYGAVVELLDRELQIDALALTETR